MLIHPQLMCTQNIHNTESQMLFIQGMQLFDPNLSGISAMCLILEMWDAIPSWHYVIATSVRRAPEESSPPGCDSTWASETWLQPRRSDNSRQGSVGPHFCRAQTFSRAVRRPQHYFSWGTSTLLKSGRGQVSRCCSPSTDMGTPWAFR